MKTSLLLFLFVHVCTFQAFNQFCSSIHKAYAYSREVLPGVAPSVVIHENGSVREKPSEGNQQYFIYAEVRKSSKIVVTHIWLNGKRYDAITNVKTTPIVIQNTKGSVEQRDTLVGKTRFKVLQFEMVMENKYKENATAKLPESEKSEGVLIEYLSKGKTRYYNMGKTKQLPPLVLQ